MRRRKAKGERKGASIRIRLTDAQKDILTAAAARLGLGLSGWLRSVALQEAARLAGR